MTREYCQIKGVDGKQMSVASTTSRNNDQSGTIKCSIKVSKAMTGMTRA